MQANWWKLLSVFLILFSLIIGLYFPLTTSVVEVSPTYVNPGKNSIKIKGYNANFENNNIKVWIENNSNKYCADNLQVTDKNNIIASFNLPAATDAKFFDIKISSENDGNLMYANAFSAKDFGTIGIDTAVVNNCNIVSFADKPQGATFPNQPILNETIRNLYFHVPFWFSMMTIMLFSFISSIQFLSNGNIFYHYKSLESVKVGLFFCVLGLLSGSVWARFTWGAWWIGDPRLNGAAITFLIYIAYYILQSSIVDKFKAARVAAVYNIFAFCMLILFLMVLPRMTDSLHPGVGGNPAFSQYDLDNTMRLVFYPAVLGWIIFGFWIYNLRYRIALLIHKQEND
jgi:heme exporter protein C